MNKQLSPPEPDVEMGQEPDEETAVFHMTMPSAVIAEAKRRGCTAAELAAQYSDLSEALCEKLLSGKVAIDGRGFVFTIH